MLKNPSAKLQFTFYSDEVKDKYCKFPPIQQLAYNHIFWKIGDPNYPSDEQGPDKKIRVKIYDN
jgi:hypothetical protein